MPTPYLRVYSPKLVNNQYQVSATIQAGATPIDVTLGIPKSTVDLYAQKLGKYVAFEKSPQFSQAVQVVSQVASSPFIMSRCNEAGPDMCGATQLYWAIRSAPYYPDQELLQRVIEIFSAAEAGDPYATDAAYKIECVKAADMVRIGAILGSLEAQALIARIHEGIANGDPQAFEALALLETLSEQLAKVDELEGLPSYAQPIQVNQVMFGGVSNTARDVMFKIQQQSRGRHSARDRAMSNYFGAMLRKSTPRFGGWESQRLRNGGCVEFGGNGSSCAPFKDCCDDCRNGLVHGLAA